MGVTVDGTRRNCLGETQERLRDPPRRSEVRPLHLESLRPEGLSYRWGARGPKGPPIHSDLG
jgi:hypothetical protein